MYYLLSDEQVILHQMVKEFAENEASLVLMVCDREDQLPMEFYKKSMDILLKSL